AYCGGSLEPGLYKVTVRKEGFVGMIRFDVRVTLLAPARVDFNLIVGDVQETITVEGIAPLVSREDVSIGARVFHEDIQRVPLNGRGLLGLLEFSPGTNVTPATRGEAGLYTGVGAGPVYGEVVGVGPLSVGAELPRFSGDARRSGAVQRQRTAAQRQLLHRRRGQRQHRCIGRRTGGAGDRWH